MKLVVGLLVGTALEFYDFAVYSQLGKYVGPNFFPAGNVYAEQLSFWAAYAVAFIVRPVGALLFGRFQPCWLLLRSCSATHLCQHHTHRGIG